MALTRITSELITDGTISTDDLSSTTVTSISGSSASSSFSSRITLVEDGTTTKTLVSSSAQIASDISGSFTAGTGLDLSSGELSVDVSDFMANGSNNRIITATGTDAQNAEANLTFDGSTLNVTGDATITGTLTAQEVHTEFESASILFTSGSTIFGDTADDVHQMTGSLRISGSSVGEHYIIGNNVGIGTDNPSSILDINSGASAESSADAGAITITSQNSGVVTALRLRHEDASGGGTDADEGIALKFQGYDGSNFRNMAQISVLANDAVGSSDSDGNIVFSTTTSGGTSLSEKMRIAESGNVGIGTDDPGRTLHIYDSSQAEIKLNTSGASNGGLIYYNDSETQLLLRAQESDGNITFQTGGTTERMRITSAGHVSSSVNLSIIKSNAMLNIEEVGGSKAYLFSGGSFTALRTTSNTPLQFGANYSSADTMFIVGEEVGIGTNNPTSDFGFTPLLHLYKDGDIAFVLDNATEKFEFVMNDDADHLRLMGGATADIISFENTGEVYVGTRQNVVSKNASHRFNVQAPANTGGWVSTFANNSYPTFQTYRTNNTTIGSYTATADNDIIGAINFHGSSASAHTLGASIDVRQVGSASTNTPTKMDFYVSNGANISNEILSLNGSTQGATFAAMLKSVFFRTDSSTTSIANNTATNISGLTSISSGFYLIHVYREDYDPDDWAAHGFVRATGHSNIHGTFTNTSGMVLSVSGNNVQLTHTLGSTHNITANWIRIA